MIRGALILLFALCASLAQAQVEVVPMTVNGRAFELVQPEGATGPLPLVLALSGAGRNGDQMRRALPLETAMSETTFRVAYLEPTAFVTEAGRKVWAWNDGVCCGLRIRPDVDDLEYLANVVAHLTELGLVAQGRSVAVVGHSNGAQMGYRFVCVHADRVFALVAISGGLALRDCVSLEGLRVLNISGSEDDRYPVSGGRSPFDPRIQHVGPQAAGESLQAAGASVQFVLVPGAGHSMPSLDRRSTASSGIGLVERVTRFMFTQ